MKALLPFFLAFGALLSSLGLHSQAHRIMGYCAADALRQPASEEAMDLALREAQLARGGGMPVLAIPVFVHIIHQNGDENIPDTQVIQGIKDLNDAFANAGAYASPDGIDTHIRFCLAQQLGPGQPTSGITRTVHYLTNVTAETQDQQLKALDWVYSGNYLNIWLVREISSVSMGSGVAGYATLPNEHGTSTDGIVVEARWFGSSPHDSKIHIHEAGHYLGLYHTFEGGCANGDCQSEGDRVCDTPPDASTAPVPCPNTVNTCTSDDDDPSLNNPFRPVDLGGSGDVDDLTANYLDYGLAFCQNLFTAGQSDRMYAALTELRSSLLSSPGCLPACPGTIADFSTASEPVMIGFPVTFVDQSVCDDPYSSTWFVDDVETATTTDLLHTFTSVGPHTVRLRIDNSVQGCFAEHLAIVLVECDAQASFTITPPDPDPGEPVTFTSTGSNTTQLQWFVDGSEAGNAFTFDWVFDEAGGHTVRLVAHGSGCSDTSGYVFVPVGPCASGMNNHMILTNRAIIDFGSGEPVVLPQQTVPLESFEGLSSISDRFGNLVFYTDGQNVVSASGDYISGQLNGGSSSSQAALVIPQPGTDSVYYIFTTDHAMGGAGNGLNYTIVDMGLNGGNGLVTALNQTLMTSASEKLTAVRSCDGQSIWIIGIKRYLGEFHAFRLSSTGLDASPVITQPGFTHGPALGCLKASPRGDKLAAAFDQAQPNTTLLFDFNNATGEVSSPINLGGTPQSKQYGVEFSPDGSKLYVTNVDMPAQAQNQVYQYDLSSGDPATISASRIMVGNGAGLLGAMQLAPNGRIYGTEGWAGTLFEIAYPDLSGASCAFTPGAVDVGSLISGYGISNLAPLAGLGALPHIEGPTTVCPGIGSVTYSFSCAPGLASISHQGSNTVLAITDSTIVLDLQNPGADTLIVVSNSPCASPNADTLIIRSMVPDVFLGNDTLICHPGQLILDAGSGGISYLWQNGSQGRFYNAYSAGTYSVTVTGEGGCTATDFIVVSTFPSSLTLDLAPPWEACPGNSGWVHAPTGYVSYQWSNGSTGDSALVQSDQVGISLTVTDSQGCQASGTKYIIELDTLIVDLGPDDVMCQGQTRTFTLPAGTGTLYIWSDGETDNSLTAYTPGTYWVAKWGCGLSTAYDTITLFPSNDPFIDLGPDTVICPWQPQLLSSGQTDATVIWSDGSTQDTLTITEPGIYWLMLVDGDGCYALDSITYSYCTGMQDMAAEGPLVMPNPNRGQFILRLQVTPYQGVVPVFDASGRLVRELRGLHPGQNPIDLGSLASGIYTLRVGGTKPQSLRVVLQGP